MHCRLILLADCSNSVGRTRKHIILRSCGVYFCHLFAATVLAKQFSNPVVALSHGDV